MGKWCPGSWAGLFIPQPWCVFILCEAVCVCVCAYVCVCVFVYMCVCMCLCPPGSRSAAWPPSLQPLWALYFLCFPSCPLAHSLAALTHLLTLRGLLAAVPPTTTSCCKETPCSLADPSLSGSCMTPVSTCQHILDLSACLSSSPQSVGSMRAGACLILVIPQCLDQAPGINTWGWRKECSQKSHSLVFVSF